MKSVRCRAPPGPGGGRVVVETAREAPEEAAGTGGEDTCTGAAVHLPPGLRPG